MDGCFCLVDMTGESVCFLEVSLLKKLSNESAFSCDLPHLRRLSTILGEISTHEVARRRLKLKVKACSSIEFLSIRTLLGVLSPTVATSLSSFFGSESCFKSDSFSSMSLESVSDVPFSLGANLIVPLDNLRRRIAHGFTFGPVTKNLRILQRIDH